jgi:hypothetical protein
VVELLKRGELHDQTKLESPEVEVFAEYTPRLAGCTYGSDEYKTNIARIRQKRCIYEKSHYSNRAVFKYDFTN